MIIIQIINKKNNKFMVAGAIKAARDNIVWT